MKTQQKLKSGWKEVELGEICEIKKGKSITKATLTKGEVPVIAGGQKPAYYHNKSNREGETITVSGSGAYAGFVAYFDIPIFASDCSTIQTDNKNVFMRYIYYFLKSKQKNIYDLQKGIAQPHIYPKQIQTIKIPLPPLQTQKAIVSILEKAEQLKEKRKQTIEFLDDYLKSVFNEMFWKKKFEEIELGNVCEINPKKSEISGLDKNTKVSFVPMEDVKEHDLYFEVNKTKKINEVYSGYTYFREDDVLLAKVTPCFENGKSGIARNLKNGIGFGSSEFHVLRSDKKILSKLIYYFVSGNKFISGGKGQLTGTGGLRRLPKNYVENFKIPLPPKELQQKFDSIVEHVEKLKEKEKQSLKEIEQLNGVLMQKAFKGELIK